MSIKSEPKSAKRRAKKPEATNTRLLIDNNVPSHNKHFENPFDESHYDIQSIINSLKLHVEQLKEAESVNPSQERILLRLYDRYEKIQLSDKPDNSSNIGFASLLVELLYKKAAATFHNLTLELILKNNLEVLNQIREILLVQSQMVDPKKTDFMVVFRLYVSIFCRKKIKEIYDGVPLVNDLLWKELYSYCDLFFGKDKDDRSYYVREIGKNQLFKGIHNRIVDMSYKSLGFVDFLIFLYYMHIASVYLDTYCEVLDDAEVKISQSQKNQILGYLIKSLSAFTHLRLRSSNSDMITPSVSTELSEECFKLFESLNKQEGGQEKAMRCGLCNNLFFYGQQKLMHFKEKNICDWCTLSLETHDQSSNDEYNQEKNSGDGAKLMEERVEESKAQIIFANENESTFLILLQNSFCMPKLISQKFELFYDVTGQNYSIIVNTEPTDKQALTTNMLYCFQMYQLAHIEWKVIRKFHNLLLFLITQGTTYNNLGSIAERLRMILKEFPRLMLTSRYFHVFSLLRFERRTDVRNFLISKFALLIETVPSKILKKFSFDGKKIMDSIKDACFECLEESDIELREHALGLIEILITAHGLFYHEKLKPAENALQVLPTQADSRDGLNFATLNRITPETPQAEHNSNTHAEMFYINESQLKRLLICCSNKEEISNLKNSALSIIFQLLKTLTDNLDGFAETSQAEKPQDVTNSSDELENMSRNPLRSNRKRKQPEKKKFKISKVKKVPLNIQKVDELLNSFLSFIRILMPNTQEKFKDYWLVSFFEQFASQMLTEIRILIKHISSQPALLKNKNILVLIYASIYQDKAIKSNAVLCDIAIALANAIHLNLETDPSDTNKPNDNRETHVSLTSIEEASSRVEVLMLQIRCLISVFVLLNKYQLNLFYKEQISSLLVYLGESMFEYPLKIFKLLAKLKIIIDLNFQIFKTIEINLRKNTNFLSLTLTQISSSFEHNESQTTRQLSYAALVPVIKCIYFIRKMLEMLPNQIFNDSFMVLIFKIVIKLFEIPEKILIQESGLLLPLFFDRGILKMNSIYEIMDRVMAYSFGIKAILSLSNKLVRKNTGQSFIGLLWRRYVEKIYACIESSFRNVDSYKPAHHQGHNNKATGEDNNQERNLNDNELEKSLETIYFLAKNKEIDLLRLFVLANGWIFVPIPKCSLTSSQIVAEILTLDSRIASNKGTAFEVLRRMALSFDNYNLLGLAKFMQTFSRSFALIKRNTLQGFFVAALDILFDTNIQNSNSDIQLLHQSFDYFIVTILFCNNESFRVTFLLKVCEQFMMIISRLQAEFILFKKSVTKLNDTGHKRKSISVNKLQEDVTLDLPKKLAKDLYYLFWICSAMYFEIQKVEAGNADSKLKDLLQDKSTSDSFKVLKDYLNKRAIILVENDPKYLYMLSRKIDDINICDNFKVLKAMIEKIENRSFMFLIENDEFNREAFLINIPPITQPKKKQVKIRKSSRSNKKSKTPLKKLKGLPQTEAKGKSRLQEETNQTIVPNTNFSAVKPKYNYRNSIMVMRGQ